MGVYGTRKNKAQYSLLSVLYKGYRIIRGVWSFDGSTRAALTSSRSVFGLTSCQSLFDKFQHISPIYRDQPQFSFVERHHPCFAILNHKMLLQVYGQHFTESGRTAAHASRKSVGYSNPMLGCHEPGPSQSTRLY